MKNVLMLTLSFVFVFSTVQAAADFDNPVAKGRWGVFMDLETNGHDATFAAPLNTEVEGGMNDIDFGVGYTVMDNLVLTLGYDISNKENETTSGTWMQKTEESGTNMVLGARWYFKDGEQLRPFLTGGYITGDLETKETTAGAVTAHHSSDHSGTMFQIGASYWVSHNFCFETHYSMVSLSHDDTSSPAMGDYDSDSSGLHFGFMWMFN